MGGRNRFVICIAAIVMPLAEVTSVLCIKPIIHRLVHISRSLTYAHHDILIPWKRRRNQQFYLLKMAPGNKVASPRTNSPGWRLLPGKSCHPKPGSATRLGVWMQRAGSEPPTLEWSLDIGWVSLCHRQVFLRTML